MTTTAGVESTTMIIAPHTGRLVREIPDTTSAQVDAAVADSRAVQRVWGRSTPAERAKVLLDLADRVEAAASLIAAQEVACTGKLTRDVMTTEIPHVVDVLRFYAGAARTQTGVPAGQYIPSHHSYVLHEPIGVVGVILPWNYPLMMLVWKLGPALAAGCTVVCKPAEQTPLTALLLATILDQVSGIPGLLTVIPGAADTGRALAASDVDLICFTGSIPAGRDVAARAGARGTPTHLELGGNCPVIILDDLDGTDLSDACDRIAAAAVFNAGQSCAAPSRLLVIGDDRRLEQVSEQMDRALAQHRPGMPDDPDASYGAMISEQQVARLARFVGMLDGDGCHVRPFARTAEPGQDTYDEELFGPGVTLTRVPDDGNAITAFASHGGWGLACSIWGRDHDRIVSLASYLDFGEVWINTHLAQTPELPHGGFGSSGHGSDMSLYGLSVFVRHKTVTARIGL